jgi:hypothetical protein
MTITSPINSACIIAWGFLLILPICYLLLRWKDNYNILEGSFNDRSFELYYKLFKPSIKPPNNKTYRDLFETNYHKSYGRRNFIIPLLIFVFVSGIGIYSLDLTLIHLFIPDKSFLILPPIALAAFLGAYLWIGTDQIQRFRTQDFTFHDFHRWSFRFIISIPVGYSFSYIVKEPLGIPIAFFLGAFPTKSLLKYTRRFTKKYLKLGDESDVASSELMILQGIEKKEAERLQDEGITNILQLAYYDPVDLTMRSTLDFLYIIDIKAQALLWIYLSDRLDNNMRMLGIRSSHETYILKMMLESKIEKNSEIAKETLKEICKLLKITTESFIFTAHQIADDPHTIFLYEIWCTEAFDSCLEPRS